MVGYNRWTNRIDFDPKSRSLEVNRSKYFLQTTPFKIVVESRDNKILMQVIHFSKYF